MALVARARSAPLVTRRRLAGVGSTPLSWARVIGWPVSFQRTSMRPDRPLAMPLMVKAALGPVILIQMLVPGTARMLPLARVALGTPRVALVRTAVEAMSVPRTWTVSAMVPRRI